MPIGVTRFLSVRPMRPATLIASQGREAGRSADTGANQLRAGDKYEDSEGTRPHGPSIATRRTDEVIELTAAPLPVLAFPELIRIRG